MLEGYKTYIVAAALALMVVLEKFLGLDVPGVDVSEDWLTLLMGALGLSTLRAGVASAAKK